MTGSDSCALHASSQSTSFATSIATIPLTGTPFRIQFIAHSYKQEQCKQIATIYREIMKGWNYSRFGRWLVKDETASRSQVELDERTPVCSKERVSSAIMRNTTALSSRINLLSLSTSKEYLIQGRELSSFRKRPPSDSHLLHDIIDVFNFSQHFLIPFFQVKLILQGLEEH